jgi:hypothetical protein
MGALLLLVAWLVREVPGAPIIFPIVGILLVFVGCCFCSLTVADEGEHLAIRFGPVPLLGKQIRYADMQSLEVGKTTFLDGWGIHLSLKGGWVWNIWGWDCVVIRHIATTRVGTDDAENLAAFLRTRIPAAGGQG